MTKETSSFSPINPNMLTPRRTAHYDVLMDGPNVEWVNGVDMSGSLTRKDASTVMSALRELGNEVAEDILSYDFKDEYYQHSLYRFLVYTSSNGSFNPDEIAAAGISMEYGGPTDRVAERNILAGFTPDIVTNITNQPVGFSAESIAQIDALTDATEMPVANNTLGSVHVSCMNRFNEPEKVGSPVRERAIDESARVLKEGGFLVWDGGFLEDYDRITQNGLVPTYLEIRLAIVETGEDTYEVPSIIFNGVFQKPLVYTK